MPSANPGIRTRENKIPPVVGTWDYDGACRPRLSNNPSNGQLTFSLGVFQWKQLSGKKKPTQVKRGKTVKRFSGSVSNPEEVYQKAEAFCKLQENKV
jgi:hypothetical protein